MAVGPVFSNEGEYKLNYEALWKLMSDFIADLKRDGEIIPSEVINDLRSSKTMIEILKVDQSHIENLLRIEEYLSNIESYLEPVIKRKYGEQCLDKWMSKVADAQEKALTSEEKPVREFPVGIPRDERWVRIKPSEEFSIQKMNHLIKEIGLKYKSQGDGYVLVYGDEDKVKEFIKRTARIMKGEISIKLQLENT